MTIASFLAIIAGLMIRFAFYGELFGGGGRGRNNQSGGQVAILMLAVMAVSVVIYAISFLLIRLLSRYRELAADRSGALLTGQPSKLASALQKVSGQIAAIPTKDLRARRRGAERVLLRAGAHQGRAAAEPGHTVLHAPLAGAAAGRAGQDLRPAGPVSQWVSWTRCSAGPSPSQPNLDALFSLPSAAITLEAATGLVPTGTGSVCFRAAEGRAFQRHREGRPRPAGHGRGRRRPAGGGVQRLLRLHLAGRPAARRPSSTRWSPTCTR